MINLKIASKTGLIYLIMDLIFKIVFIRYLQIRKRDLVTLQLSDEGKQIFYGNNRQNKRKLRATLNYKKKRD